MFLLELWPSFNWSVQSVYITYEGQRSLTTAARVIVVFIILSFVKVNINGCASKLKSINLSTRTYKEDLFLCLSSAWKRLY